MSQLSGSGISRRTLIRGLGASMALMRLPRALGQASQGLGSDLRHFYVQIFAEGGADVTLGLDPLFGLEEASSRPPESDLFLGYGRTEMVEPDGTGIALGPAAKALAGFRKDICIVNGVLTHESDQAHPSNLTHMRTGTHPDNGNAGNHPSLPIAFGMLRGPLPFEVVTAGNSAGFFPLTGPGIVQSYVAENVFQASQKGWEIRELEDFIAGHSQESSIYRTYQRSLGQIRIAPAVEAQFKKLGAQSGDWEKLIAAFFLAGGSDLAEISLVPKQGVGVDSYFYMDSHSDHYRSHLGALSSVFSQLANLFRVFKAIPYGSGSLFDATTFLFCSEFSRTPYLNPKAGKDHNPLTNSVLLAGRGVRGGQVVGQSLIYSPAELERVGGRIAQASGSTSAAEFLARFKDEHGSGLRSAHVGARMRVEGGVAKPIGRFERGWQVTPAAVALTVQKVMGLGGGLEALKTHDPEQWLPQVKK